MTAATPDHRADLGDILAFYAEADADEALEDRPVDRFAAAVRRPASASASGSSVQAPPGHAPAAAKVERTSRAAPTAPARPAAAVPDEAQAALARELAGKAATLAELREAM